MCPPEIVSIYLPIQTDETTTATEYWKKKKMNSVVERRNKVNKTGDHYGHHCGNRQFSLTGSAAGGLLSEHG